MRITQLQISDLRLFADLSLRLAPGINFITGANGAGKTSLLEAMHLLGYGRSFRGGSRDTLIRHGRERLQVFARWQTETGERRTGLTRSDSDWQAKLDGQRLPTLGELHRACAVICFEPGSHELLAGAAEQRRRYLDWALFHVEPDFLSAWRRYQRALRQRNSLLRASARNTAEYLPWEQEMASTAHRIDVLREQQLSRSASAATPLLSFFLAELGEPDWRYRRGWSKTHDFADLLASNRERDLRLGYSFSGPHRADWQLRFENLPEAAPLSRGQEKLAALACVLAQVDVLKLAGHEAPLVLLDDLASELDREHQARVWRQLRESGVQVVATGTERPPSLPGEWVDALFHVERQGDTATLKPHPGVSA
ncbi:MAG: DNA replication/repair protein RecF [Xanthomonadales bacterium]|nr:DNA replication/repair protein RecF [Xanthomonadales bacterium]